MYGLSMSTIHMLNRMTSQAERDLERKAIFDPELRQKSIVLRKKRENEKLKFEQLRNRIVEDN